MISFADQVIDILKKRYKCPYFRILVIGRANAGKTTILEKVCAVEKGTKPIVYHQGDADLKGTLNILQMMHFDLNTVMLEPSDVHLAPTIEASQVIWKLAPPLMCIKYSEGYT